MTNEVPTSEAKAPTMEDLHLQVNMSMRQVKLLSNQIASLMAYNSELEVKIEVMGQMIQQRETELAHMVAKLDSLKHPLEPTPRAPEPTISSSDLAN